MSIEAASKAIKPRLWGEWQAQFYGSGTTIVVLRKHQHKPHLYIYADVAADDDTTQTKRASKSLTLNDARLMIPRIGRAVERFG